MASPLAGRQLELRSGLGGKSPDRDKQRNSSQRVDVSTNYLFHEVRFVATSRVACQPHGVSGGRRRRLRSVPPSAGNVTVGGVSVYEGTNGRRRMRQTQLALARDDKVAGAPR